MLYLAHKKLKGKIRFVPFGSMMPTSVGQQEGSRRLQVATRGGSGRLQEPVLLGPSGKPVVKMFVFAPSQYYDFVSQVPLHASAWLLYDVLCYMY